MHLTGTSYQLHSHPHGEVRCVVFYMNTRAAINQATEECGMRRDVHGVLYWWVCMYATVGKGKLGRSTLLQQGLKIMTYAYRAEEEREICN